MLARMKMLCGCEQELGCGAMNPIHGTDYRCGPQCFGFRQIVECTGFLTAMGVKQIVLLGARAVEAKTGRFCRLERV